MGFSENLSRARERISQAAARTGRAPDSVSIVAVTKGLPHERVAEAAAAGMAVFGESRVQEAAEKVPAVAGEWHLIGHLQSNKVKDAVALFSMIQSVDSVRLAKEISREALAAGKVMPVLLQVNISGEAQKHGFAPADVYAALDEIGEFESVRVSGLMGMAAQGADAGTLRASFKTLKMLFGACRSAKAKADMRWLSMGMSDDFETAVEEGANMVRLGRALFS